MLVIFQIWLIVTGQLYDYIIQYYQIRYGCENLTTSVSCSPMTFFLPQITVEGKGAHCFA